MKEAKFFCDNCGVQVKRDAVVCPSCGRFFSSVRCPKCGYTAKASRFLYGCPKCGYAPAKSDGASSRPAPQAKAKTAAPPSVWAYIITACVVIAAVAALILCLQN
jgi:ssDNA-binding Zn-finger/Zn-ribbon topoisomerase 1